MSVVVDSIAEGKSAVEFAVAADDNAMYVSHYVLGNANVNWAMHMIM